MPYRDILTALMQRLVSLVGHEEALERARNVPGLIIDSSGSVVDFDRENPRGTFSLLAEQYEQAFAAHPEAPAAPIGSTPPPAAAIRAPELVAAPVATPTRILLVDDHALVREGLVNLLDPQLDLQVVGQASSMQEAVTLARTLHPDLILMDFTLPDGTGDEATRLILATQPETKIVFLTVHDEDERLFAALSAGATGYMLKSIRSADLLNKLRSVVNGDVALSPTIGRRVLDGFVRRAAPAPEPVLIDDLTEREIEILRQIVHGFTNRQIADALNLSVRTVEYHRANLTSKLGLHSRADLVRYATEHGLLESRDAGPRPPPDRREKP